jgi:ADP-ribose pyrophosphatase YjhB (NUDIX family)
VSATPATEKAPFERHFTATAYVVSGERTLLMWHRKLGMWLPPGGHCEPNEDPVQAACREAEEESGLAVEVIPPANLLTLAETGGPEVLPPPEVILVEEIRAAGQPLHHHIDHVYFTRPIGGAVDFDAAVPGGIHRWVTREEMSAAFALTAPDGTVVAVAEDVRLLAIRAIAAAAARSSAC